MTQSNIKNTMDLREKKTNLENLLNQKLSKLREVENARGQLSNEILDLRGRISMLDELLSEDESEEKPRQDNRDNNQSAESGRESG